MSLFVKTITYTGNGSGTQSFSLTFTPKVVIIWGPAQSSGTTFSPCFKTDAHPSNDSSRFLAVSNFTNGILTFSGDSFVVGGTATNGLNISSKVYYVLVLGGTDCVTGSYTGNGSDNRNITGLGINPDLVFTKRDGNSLAVQKTTSTGKTTDTSGPVNNVTYAANQIQQLISDGFQVGTDNTVNRNSDTYYYFAVTLSGNTSIFNEGTYTGNSTDDRDITGIGFTPSLVFIKGDITEHSRIRTFESTDTAASWSSVNTTGNTIQATLSDGFQVGTSAAVNAGTSSYFWFAFKDNEPSQNTGNFLAFM
jgi:ribulose bisphosphate carboxylase small subunit